MSRQPAVQSTRVQFWERGRHWSKDDVIAVEEPLEIRLGGFSVAVTMRTPGDDFDLVRGFLITEGIVGTADDIASVAFCEEHESPGNIVNANVHNPQLLDPTRWQRNFYAASSCGICGKATMDAVRLECRQIDTPCSVEVTTLYRLEAVLLEQQGTFRRTGGLHAAAIFDLGGDAVVIREDIGRHNAVDKVIGSIAGKDSDSLQRSLLMVSGRASFEVVQKALKAGIPIVAAVSAPSSLAVELAASMGMTLVGFLRQGRCNVYSGSERVVGDDVVSRPSDRRGTPFGEPASAPDDLQRK